MMMSNSPGDFHCLSLGEDQEELFTENSNSNVVDTQFDIIIGYIEDIIMEEKFQTLQNSFLERFYKEFEETEENKFIYTDIHKEYVNVLEKCLEDELSMRVPDFSMIEFTKQIIERKSELDGEIFEILLTFSDFVAFKDMFLDYRAAKEGKTVDLSTGLTITSYSEMPCDRGEINFGQN
ncbi:hypothetical protein SNE40_012976 [Patella caerulea]|uniref:ADP-ribosylation factor-like protein 2-binding protein n=1 Tax=Patella caerulea TaxID=87958 RepID=A0AAN8JM23_PATCE